MEKGVASFWRFVWQSLRICLNYYVMRQDTQPDPAVVVTQQNKRDELYCI